MHKILRGAPVRDQIDNEIIAGVESFKSQGVVPTVATFRIGDDDGEIYYENAIIKRSAKYGMIHKGVVMDAGVTQEEAEEALRSLNDDAGIHGIIMLMPFPKNINEDRLKAILNPDKDIDAITDTSYAYLFANKKDAFFACTAESCMEILKFYDYDLTGKQVTILGRSLRVGKPLLLMMMNANATVTVCHTRTKREDMEAAIDRADIVILATGQIESYTADLFRDGQVVIDVGTGTGKDGKMAGDLDAKGVEASETLTELAYSPVPGGVGTVTTALLLRNVLKAARIQLNI